MSENKKILLVDDEADIALAFSLGLESNGFSASSSTSKIFLFSFIILLCLLIHPSLFIYIVIYELPLLIKGKVK